MSRARLLLAILIVGGLVGGYAAHRWWTRGGQRASQMFAWFRDNSLYPEKRLAAGTHCGSAPFIFPTDGMAGFLWGDSFRPGHTHQGVDIFSGSAPGETAVIAAYPGFLTRLPDWISTVIVRVPADPLHPARQVWVYYTHMADAAGNSFVAAEFPPGTFEAPVSAGTLLGYMGNYSGEPGSPTGVHLHISIVKDDGRGNFMNELEIRNTYDPSPYFGMALNAYQNPDEIPVCEAAQ
jgi:hypothetical protein